MMEAHCEGSEVYEEMGRHNWLVTAAWPGVAN